MGRPGFYGNPFKIGRWYAKGGAAGYENPPRSHGTFSYGEIQFGDRKARRVYICSETQPKSKKFHLMASADETVQWYRWYLSAVPVGQQIKDELRGKDLACWCKEGQPCHADVLLEIANS